MIGDFLFGISEFIGRAKRLRLILLTLCFPAPHEVGYVRWFFGDTFRHAVLLQNPKRHSSSLQICDNRQTGSISCQKSLSDRQTVPSHRQNADTDRQDTFANCQPTISNFPRCCRISDPKNESAVEQEVVARESAKLAISAGKSEISSLRVISWCRDRIPVSMAGKEVFGVFL